MHINQNVEIVKLDLNFLGTPKPSWDNYVNVTQNSPEWFSVRKHKVTGSRFSFLIRLYEKSKFGLTWEVVKEGKSNRDLTLIKNISRGHHYEDEAITNFQSILNCKTEKCGFFLHPTDSRYGSSPDVLRPLEILLEVKTRGEGFLVLWGHLKSSYIILFSVSCKCYALVLSSVFYNLTTLNQRLQNFSLLNIIIH